MVPELSAVSGVSFFSTGHCGKTLDFERLFGTMNLKRAGSLFLQVLESCIKILPPNSLSPVIIINCED